MWRKNILHFVLQYTLFNDFFLKTTFIWGGGGWVVIRWSNLHLFLPPLCSVWSLDIKYLHQSLSLRVHVSITVTWHPYQVISDYHFGYMPSVTVTSGAWHQWQSLGVHDISYWLPCYDFCSYYINDCRPCGTFCSCSINVSHVKHFVVNISMTVMWHLLQLFYQWPPCDTFCSCSINDCRLCGTVCSNYINDCHVTPFALTISMTVMWHLLH